MQQASSDYSTVVLAIWIVFLLVGAGCNSGSEDSTSSSRDTASGTDATAGPDTLAQDGGPRDSDGQSGADSQRDTDADQSSDTGGSPWYEKQPASLGELGSTVGYLFAAPADSGSTSYVSVVREGNTWKLGGGAASLGWSLGKVVHTGGWVFLDAPDSKQLHIRSPAAMDRSVHRIEYGDHLGEGFSDVAFHPQQNATFLVHSRKPQLYVVTHGRTADTWSTIDLAEYDSDGNPNPRRLLVDGDTLLVGLSRTLDESGSSNPSRGAKVLALDVESRQAESVVDLPVTDVGPGFAASPEGDLAVGVSGKHQKETSDGWMAAATDGAVFRLQHGAGGYQRGAKLVSEEAIGKNLTDFALLDGSSGVASAFFAAREVVRFEFGGTSSEVTTYENESSRLDADFCTWPAAPTVGLLTRRLLNNPGPEAMLLYEGPATKNPTRLEPSFEDVEQCLAVVDGTR